LAAFARLLQSEKDWLNVDNEFDLGIDLLEGIMEDCLTDPQYQLLHHEAC
jgi:hypothetical protein